MVGIKNQSLFLPEIQHGRKLLCSVFKVGFMLPQNCVLYCTCGIVKSNLEVKESRPCQHASWLRFNREEAVNTSIVLSFCYRMIWVMDSIPWVRCASGNVSSLCQDSNLSSQVDPDPCVKVSEFTAIATLLAPSTVLILDIFLFALFLLLNFGSVCKSRGGGSG